MEHAGLSQAALNKQLWPEDRSILGKILLNKRRAQVGELTRIAEVTDHPPFVGRNPAPEEKIALPSRPKVAFHVKEWRIHSEKTEADLAKALKIDEDSYSFLESRPYKFSIEQLMAAASAMKIGFDQLRWLPPKKDAAKPAQAAPSVRAPRKINIRGRK